MFALVMLFVVSLLLEVQLTVDTSEVSLAHNLIYNQRIFKFRPSLIALSQSITYHHLLIDKNLLIFSWLQQSYIKSTKTTYEIIPRHPPHLPLPLLSNRPTDLSPPWMPQINRRLWCWLCRPHGQVHLLMFTQQSRMPPEMYEPKSTCHWPAYV